jgi:hypothetical protein
MLAELAEVGSGAVIAQLDLAGLAALVAIELVPWSRTGWSPSTCRSTPTRSPIAAVAARVVGLLLAAAAATTGHAPRAAWTQRGSCAPAERGHDFSGPIHHCLGLWQATNATI